jgi:hypothetical protein
LGGGGLRLILTGRHIGTRLFDKETETIWAMALRQRVIGQIGDPAAA